MMLKTNLTEKNATRKKRKWLRSYVQKNLQDFSKQNKGFSTKLPLGKLGKLGKRIQQTFKRHADSQKPCANIQSIYKAGEDYTGFVQHHIELYAQIFRYLCARSSKPVRQFTIRHKIPQAGIGSYRLAQYIGQYRAHGPVFQPIVHHRVLQFSTKNP